MKVDAALLVGDKGRSRPIRGDNKNFLYLKGLPLFFYVLQSLDQAQRVNRVFIVGDRNRILGIVKENAASLHFPEKIFVLEQSNTLYDNAEIAFETAVSNGATEELSLPEEERAILYLAGDMPLIIPQEIDLFIERCDLDHFDYFLGMSTEGQLRPFYPKKGQRGIKMAYFYVREEKFRINNLHLVKPLRISNRHLLQKMYDYRHQKEFFNFLKLLWMFCRLNLSWRGTGYYLILHWNLFMARLGLEWLTSPFRRLISVGDAESVLGDMLGCRLRIVNTDLVGAALDIDNEKDYQAVAAMFDQWRDYQNRLVSKLGLNDKQPIKTAS